MKNSKLIIPISILLIILCIIGYKIYLKKTTSDFELFELSVSSLKDTYLLGEDVYIKFTIENKGKLVDSLFNFSDGTLAFSSEIRNDNNTPIPYEGNVSDIYFYQKINPGEKKDILANVGALRGPEGSPGFSYFPLGNYTTRGVYKDANGKIIKSNKIKFKVIQPEGTEAKAFEDFKYFPNYFNKFRNRTITKEDNILLTEKSIEFLYKYPNSVYTGKILTQNCFARYYADYKYDEQLLKDIEYYISNNSRSPDNLSLLYRASTLCEKLGGKTKAIEYFDKLRNNIKSKELDSLIAQLKIKLNY
ncbi:MAG: hypothetical protein PHN88_00225 [Ignavibacteria bacterium]|nr:hypothetical protein [Ignavibacteria bacterium]